mmetsp:Transcript_38195/g.122574  ORF Transcript_38195/g.122574 Transcript_38195/m.122574 type:complete len:253 (+) Transcript_38195:24-782(+)
MAPGRSTSQEGSLTLRVEQAKEGLKRGDKTADLVGGALDFGKQLGALTGLDEATRRKRSQELCEEMGKVVALKHEYAADFAALDAAKADVLAARDGDGDVDVLAIFRRHKRPPPPSASEPDVQRLRKLCKLDNDDDDVEVDETLGATLNDPYTLAVFVEPQKSKKCGHVYSKSTVLRYFGTRGQKCAHPGCTAFLKVQDFERDVEKELEIKRYEKRNTSQSQQPSSSSQSQSHFSQRGNTVDLDDDDDDLFE